MAQARGATPNGRRRLGCRRWLPGLYALSLQVGLPALALALEMARHSAELAVADLRYSVPVHTGGDSPRVLKPIGVGLQAL